MVFASTFRWLRMPTPDSQTRSLNSQVVILLSNVSNLRPRGKSPSLVPEAPLLRTFETLQSSSRVHVLAKLELAQLKNKHIVMIAR